jgi:hypothetical protein
MKRFRLAVVAAIAVLVVVTGSAFALSQPHRDSAPLLADESQEPVDAQDEAPPSATDVAHAVDRLQASGYSVDADTVADLAGAYGVGGAVRIVAWADASGHSVDEIRALRDAGEGWGQIAKDLGVHPGIGSIMGNGSGHGRETAPGQLKKAETGS